MLQRCEYAPYEILQIETMKVFFIFGPESHYSFHSVIVVTAGNYNEKRLTRSNNVNVLNNNTTNLFITNSKDFNSALFRSKGSSPYTATGKHLLRISCNTSNSDAKWHTLPRTAVEAQ